MTALTDITAQLAEPFAFDDVDLLPKGKVERDGKTLCMALPYADPRVYQDRLNALAPGEWETPAPIALTVGDKLVTYVTVILCGITHTDVGEAGPGENQGTEAWAQAFKRACSQFGLGRYLYDLEKAWVPYNPQRKQIDLDANGRRNVVRTMYQKAGIGVQAPSSMKPAVSDAPAQPLASNIAALPEIAPAIARMIDIAVDRCKKIGEPWPKIKAEALDRVVPDTEIVVTDFTKINGLITRYEKQAGAERRAS